MYGEYPEDVLRRLQLTELEILKDFTSVCQELKLPYFMVGGCAIGVVRHKGFIPWDDDIDVGMLRKDYERFKEEAIPRLREKYTFNMAEENWIFPVPIMFMGRKGTKFVEKALKDLPLDFGIRIDIAPLDAISDDKKERKKQIYRAWFWEKMYMLRQIPYPNLTFVGIKKWIVRTICWLLHYGMKLLHISSKRLLHQYEKYANAFNEQETEYIKHMEATYPEKCIMRRSDVFPTISMEFEGISVEMPNNYHRILTEMYGDYMQLPPVEQRKNHYPFLLSFGDEETGEI